MKKTIFLILGILFLNTSYGQQIEMNFNLLGYQFIQDGEKLSWKELVKATESNTEANLLIKKARAHNTVSTIASIVSGALIGIPVGQSIHDEDPNWTLAYIGGGIAVIGIPFSFSAINKANKGVDEYNLSLKSSSAYEFNPEFKLIATGNGIGLSLNF